VNNPTALLEISGVAKAYGEHCALSSVSLSVCQSEVVLLLGANGAGKSTLLRIMAGLGRADRGVVEVCREPCVGFCSHHGSLYAKLTVRENIALTARALGVLPREVDEACSTWGIDKYHAKEVRELSKGMYGRVALARAFLGSPRVVLLDEPSSNLDQEGVDILCSKVASGGTEKAIVIATHDISRLQDVATRVVVLERGVVVADSVNNSDRGEVLAQYYGAGR
jgi:heme exporter protein A